MEQSLRLIVCIFIIAELIGDVISFEPKSAVIFSEKIRSSKITSTVLKRRSFLRHSTEDIVDENDDRNSDELQRRKFLKQFSVIVTAPLLVPRSANAFGLVQFPCTLPLLNTYHVMRAGQNLLEEEDIISTNPLFLTNREAALSQKGREQVQVACQFLEENQINPSVVKYSLAASAMDTTAIVKEALKVGQNRIIPEFTFMDPRGIGKWDMMSYSQTLPAIYALDEAEAGKDGRLGRPPPNEDGTPNETLAEQKVRLVQLMSVLETQFQGDTVLLIFPDGSTPALLSCMMAGIPFNKVHELEFAPGEVRLDLTMESVKKFYETRQQQLAFSGEYEKTLQMGKIELERLQGLDPATIVNKKDLKIEMEAAEIEEQQRQRDEQKRIRQQKEEEARILRQQQIQEAKEREAQARLKKQQEAAEAKAKREQQAALKRMARSNSESPAESGDKSTQFAIGGVASLTVVAALTTGQSDTDPVVVSSGSATMRNETLLSPSNETIGNLDTTTTLNATIIEEEALPSNATSANSLPDTLPKLSLPLGDAEPLDEESSAADNSTAAQDVDSSGMPESLPQVALPLDSGTSSNVKSLYSDPVPTMKEKKEAAKKAMEEYLDQDDGGEDWLTVMGQLMEEDDEEDEGELDTINGWQ